MRALWLLAGGDGGGLTDYLRVAKGIADNSLSAHTTLVFLACSEEGKGNTRFGACSMDVVVQRVQEFYRLLQSSTAPLWCRLRYLLAEKGINPQTSLVADFFPDDCQFEFGLVVAQDRRVFQFGFDYLHKTIAEGAFSEWEELTDRYHETPYDEQISVALQMLS